MLLLLLLLLLMLLLLLLLLSPAISQKLWRNICVGGREMMSH